MFWTFTRINKFILNFEGFYSHIKIQINIPFWIYILDFKYMGW